MSIDSSLGVAFFAALMSDTRGDIPGSLADLINRPAWMDLGACRDRPDIDWSDPDPEPEALRVCWSCPVINDCNLHALHYRETGTWGGQSERARLGRKHSNVAPRRWTPDQPLPEPVRVVPRRDRREAARA